MTLPTLMVEAAFGGVGNNTWLTLDDPVRGKLDTGTLAPPLAFTDISAYVREVSIGRGRSRPLETYRAGTFSITLDNRDGRFDPNNLSGPYVSTGVSQVIPMVPVRVRCSFGGTIHNLAYGYADSWGNTYRKPHDSIITLQATDGFKVLANFEPGGPSGSVGASETTGARIGRIATNAGWSATDRDIETGVSTVQATDLGTNALSEMQAVALSELGQLFMSADGKLTFHDRSHRVLAIAEGFISSAYVGIEFSDTPGSTYDYQDISVAFDDELIKNSVAATNIGGTIQQAADSASIGNYLTKSYNATNLWLETDLDALLWAEQVLVFSADAELRVDSLKFQFGGNTNNLTAILGAEFGDLFQVVRHPPAGDTITRLVFFDGISWSIKPGNWSAVASFTSASKYGGIILADDVTVGGAYGLDDPRYVLSW